MFRLIVVLALCSSALALRPRLDGRIVGGTPSDIQNFPYQLSLQSYGSHICGASIIGPNWVLTASHCVDGASASSISFRAGSSIRGSGGTVHKASKIIMHPQYNPNNVDYDFAVVQVSTNFPLGSSGVQAARMASSEPAAGTNVVVSGWGATSEGGIGLPSQLQSVQVPIVSRSVCKSAYGSSAITDRMICAGVTQGGKDSCQGDSGGPLFNPGSQELVGVVSWGYGCARPSYPGVYSNIANQRDWIRQQTSI